MDDVADYLTSPGFLKTHPSMPSPDEPLNQQFKGDESINQYAQDAADAYEGSLRKRGASEEEAKLHRKSFEPFARERAKEYALDTMASGPKVQSGATTAEYFEHLPIAGHFSGMPKHMVEAMNNGQGTWEHYYRAAEGLAKERDEANRGFGAGVLHTALGLGQFGAEFALTGGAGGALAAPLAERGALAAAGRLGASGKLLTGIGGTAKVLGYGAGATAAMPQRIAGPVSQGEPLGHSVVNNYIDNTIFPALGVFGKQTGSYGVRLLKSTLMGLGAGEASQDIKAVAGTAPQAGALYRSVFAKTPEERLQALKELGQEAVAFGIVGAVTDGIHNRGHVAEALAAGEKAQETTNERNAVNAPAEAAGVPQTPEGAEAENAQGPQTRNGQVVAPVAEAQEAAQGKNGQATQAPPVAVQGEVAQPGVQAEPENGIQGAKSRGPVPAPEGEGVGGAGEPAVPASAEPAASEPQVLKGTPFEGWQEHEVEDLYRQMGLKGDKSLKAKAERLIRGLGEAGINQINEAKNAPPEAPKPPEQPLGGQNATSEPPATSTGQPEAPEAEPKNGMRPRASSKMTPEEDAAVANQLANAREQGDFINPFKDLVLQQQKMFGGGGEAAPKPKAFVEAPGQQQLFEEKPSAEVKALAKSFREQHNEGIREHNDMVKQSKDVLGRNQHLLNIRSRTEDWVKSLDEVAEHWRSKGFPESSEWTDTNSLLEKLREGQKKPMSVEESMKLAREEIENHKINTQRLAELEAEHEQLEREHERDVAAAPEAVQEAARSSLQAGHAEGSHNEIEGAAGEDAAERAAISGEHGTESGDFNPAELERKPANGMRRRKGGPDLEELARIRAEKEAQSKPVETKKAIPSEQVAEWQKELDNLRQQSQSSSEMGVNPAVAEASRERRIIELQDLIQEHGGEAVHNPAKFGLPKGEVARARKLGIQASANKRMQAGGGLLFSAPTSFGGAGEKLEQIADGVKRMFAPASRGPEAAEAAGIVREEVAHMVRQDDIAHAALKEGKAILDKWVADPTHRVNNFLHFTDAIEHGRIHTLDPELQPIGQAIRQLNDATEAEAKRLGLLQNGTVENYLGHIWKDPNSGLTPEQIAQKLMLARRPLAGSEAFKKQRTLPTFRDGIDAGLEPVTWNPVEMALLKNHEVNKSIMAKRVVDKLKAAGLQDFVKLGGRAPDGWVSIDDKLARVFAPPQIVPGAIGPMLTGKYYFPEPVALILNNYLAPGLRGNAVYDAFRGLGNAMNQASLGLSFFHGGFTTLDSVVSSTALSLQMTARGDFGQAAKQLIKTPIAPIRNYLTGSKMIKEWSNPGSQGGEIPQLTALWEKGAGRAAMDKFYGGDQLEKFRTNLRTYLGGDVTALPGVVGRGLTALAEITSKPVMEYYVPRMKAGVMADMARYEMSKLGQNATPAEERQVFQKAQQSVDNRMGQMTYDNLFWNKMGKDLAMLAVRSVGWNVGTIAEVGGGIKDIPSSIKGVFQGKGISPRLAYAIALPMTVGAIGGMMHYLMTGKRPEEPKDYFFPQTGRTLQDGTAERLSLPSYMKDIAHLANRGGEGPMRIVSNAAEMAKGKVHPLITTLAEMASNKDYFDRPIWNPNDPSGKQVRDSLIHFGESFKPFSLKQPFGEEQGPAMRAAQFVGVTRSPAYIRRTDQELLERESPEATARRDFGKALREMKETGQRTRRPRNGLR